jgi:hypothetical protein
MNNKMIKKTLIVYSLLLLITAPSVLIYWLFGDLEITPFILTSVSISSLLVLILTILCLYKQHDTRIKFFIAVNSLTIIIIALLVYVLPATAFSKYSKEKIIEYFELENISGGGGGYPAVYGFPMDDDNTVNTEGIRSYFGSRKIYIIQGFINKAGEFKGRKVLVVYECAQGDPIGTMAVFELDGSYDTEKRGKDQGYERSAYPIIDVLIRPGEE